MNNALDIIASRIDDRFWLDRIADMIRHVEIQKGSPNRDNVKSPIVKVDRVSKSWPMRGSIYVTREDGRRFRLYFDGVLFRTEEVS